MTVQPQTVQITLDSVPHGLQIVYGGESGATPLTRTTIVNSAHTIQAPSPQGGLGIVYNFTGWSDGGAQEHNITMGTANVTYTATYQTGFTAIRVNAGRAQLHGPVR